MNDELTPREHDDMRDLLMAGTQRIRPAVARRTWIPASVAAILVAGTVGAVAIAALNGGWRADSAATSPPTPTATPSAEPTRLPTPTPLPTFRPWGETPQEPYVDVPSSIPSVPAPPPGGRLTLRAVPKADNRLILGTGPWLEAQGIDILSAQGFEKVGGVWPWAARLRDGSGSCILIRSESSTGPAWTEVICDEDGVRATVEREVDGALLRFTIEGNAIDVSNVPR